MATLTCGTGGSYATLAAAHAAATAGDTLQILPGSYSGAGWVDVTLATRVTVTGTDVTLTDTTGSCVTLQAAGCVWDGADIQIVSSSTGTALNVTGSGCTVRGWVRNTNASGEALILASGATSGDYSVIAENTSGGSTSFGIKVSVTGNPGLIHDCVITGYQYAIEYIGAAQTAHIIRRCVLEWATRGVSIPYNATLINVVLASCGDGLYSGVGVTVHHCTFYDCSDGIHALGSAEYTAIKNCIFDTCTVGLRGAAGDEVAPDFCNFNDCNSKVTNWTAPTNEVAGDPDLGVDYTPGEGSPVLDAGADLGYTDDLYHASGWRPQGAAPDIGAVERESSPPPSPPTPLTGKRWEVHRIWYGGEIGTITLGGSDYTITIPRARETLHDLIARIVSAVETATGEDWSGWLSPDLELCLGCGQTFDWTGTVAWNAFAGWADGTAPAAPDSGYLLTGTAGAAAERVAAAAVSWPILHAYRMVSVQPAASVPLVAYPYRAPAIDLDTTIFCEHDSPAILWTCEEWCLYRGTDAEVATWTDTDGWIILRPLDEADGPDLPVDGYAGTITIKRRNTRIAA